MASQRRVSISTHSSSTTATYPMPSGLKKKSDIREVGIEDYKAVALQLARAFKDDDVSFYFIRTPDDAHRTEEDFWKLHVEVMEYIVAAHCYNGKVFTTGENHEGVSLWMPPGCNMDDYYTIFRSGMWRLWYKLSAEGKKRYFDEFLNVLHDVKTEVLGPRDANSWYLVYIGVVEEARGKGLARRMIDHVTTMADQMNMPCYLESSNIVNVPIYEKFGFRQVKKIVLTRTETPVCLDAMVREPIPVLTHRISKKHDGWKAKDSKRPALKTWTEGSHFNSFNRLIANEHA